jgi:hypothetical protein
LLCRGVADGFAGFGAAGAGAALEDPGERPTTISPAPTAASASTATIIRARVREPMARVITL